MIQERARKPTRVTYRATGYSTGWAEWSANPTNADFAAGDLPLNTTLYTTLSSMLRTPAQFPWAVDQVKEHVMTLSSHPVVGPNASAGRVHPLYAGLGISVCSGGCEHATYALHPRQDLLRSGEYRTGATGPGTKVKSATTTTRRSPRGRTPRSWRRTQASRATSRQARPSTSSTGRTVPPTTLHSTTTSPVPARLCGRPQAAPTP